MDESDFKSDFKEIIKEKNRLKMELANLTEMSDCKNALLNELKDLGKTIKGMYEAAIILDVDLEDCRLLNVYRFFFRNLVKINELLRDVRLPSGLNGIWGIVVLTGIIFLYAAV